MYNLIEPMYICKKGAVKKASKEKEGFSQEKYLAESFFSGIIKLQ